MIYLILPKIKYISFHVTWCINISIWEFIWHDGEFCPALSTAPLTVDPCSLFLVSLCTLPSCILTPVWSLHVPTRVSLTACQWHPHLVTRSGRNLEGFRKNDVLLVSKAQWNTSIILGIWYFLATSCGFLKWPELSKIQVAILGVHIIHFTDGVNHTALSSGHLYLTCPIHSGELTFLPRKPVYLLSINYMCQLMF